MLLIRRVLYWSVCTGDICIALYTYLNFSLHEKLFHYFPVPFPEAGMMDGYAKGESEPEIGVHHSTCQLLQLSKNQQQYH